MRPRIQFRSSTSTAELDLKDLKEDLRSFIEQCRKGNLSTKELVSKEGTEIKKHVSTVSAETNKVLAKVQQGLNSLVLCSDVKSNQAKQERLLRSLKYLGLNERRNQVSEAYNNTGRWIFVGDGNTSCMTKDSSLRPEATDSEVSEEKEAMHNDQHSLSTLKWDSFSNWLRSTDTVYWISGKPGSGKSTLVKFILHHPDTKAFLEIWQPGTLIISHFFWRPGTSLQQNIKGLLCSLLHQLLQNSATALNYALSSVPDSGIKDTDTDWSTAELLDLCLRVSSAYEFPLCIFLDGLDEVDPRDGVDSLLSVINRISQSSNVKLCLSSRPEPLLQRRFSSYPQVRLQDLNRSDLELYARDHIKYPSECVARHYGHPIRSLVHRSEGVFLWLVLATKSINRGVEYGDNFEKFEERIRHLPGDLISLYNDMWKRAGKDDPLSYRQTAALYFRLLLTHREKGSLFRDFFDSFEILPFMLASTSTADCILQAGDQTPQRIPNDVMLQRCRDVERQVDDYCFGLVEVGPRSIPVQRPRIAGMYGRYYDDLIPFTDSSSVVRFIHRTAHDFLVNTEEGKEILDFSTSSQMSLETCIIKAYLAETQLFLHYHDSEGFVLRSAEIHLLMIRSLRLTYRDTDDWVPGGWRQLLHYFESLCKAGKLLVGSNHDVARLCKGEDFLKVLANSCGDEYILSAIREGNLSEDAKSEILLNACNTFDDSRCCLHPSDHFVEESIQMLLREGANPNYKGIMFSPVSWHWPFAQIQTPFTQYLEDKLLFIKFDQLRSEDLLTVLATLSTYLYYDADLSETITLLFDLRHWPILDSDNSDFENRVLPEYKSSTRIMDPLPLSRISSHIELITDRNQDSILCVSFTAYSILDCLLHRMRQDFSPPVEKTKFRAMISFLHNQCMGRDMREDYRVIGGICNVENNEPGWFETTSEHERRIASEILIFLWDFQSPYNDQSQWMKAEAYGERVKSLCVQAPWVRKACGKNAIWERCEELGIFTRVNRLGEVHTTMDWIKKWQL